MLNLAHTKIQQYTHTHTHTHHLPTTSLSVYNAFTLCADSCGNNVKIYEISFVNMTHQLFMSNWCHCLIFQLYYG